MANNKTKLTRGQQYRLGKMEQRTERKRINASKSEAKVREAQKTARTASRAAAIAKGFSDTANVVQQNLQNQSQLNRQMIEQYNKLITGNISGTNGVDPSKRGDTPNDDSNSVNNPGGWD